MNVFTRVLTAIAITFVLVASYLMLAERVAGTGATTSVRAIAFSSASGPMASDSFAVTTSLGETGWVGRAQSSSFSIHLGLVWTTTVSTGGSVPPMPIPVPSLTEWGLVILALALGAIAVLKTRRARNARPGRS